MIHRVEAKIGEKKLVIETGRMARQSDGAVLLEYGESVVLVTAVASNVAKDVNFLPLTVDYQERAYAGGKIPGGFFKREGRLGEREILTSRLIDRPLRPLLPDNWFFETQIIASVLSSDQGGANDILGIIGSSAAMTISDIPFEGPTGAVRVGRIDEQFVVNPSLSDLDKSDMNIVVVGTADAVMMVESESEELSEQIILEAIQFGHGIVKKVIDLQNELRALAGKKKRTIVDVKRDKELGERIREELSDSILEAVMTQDKTARQTELNRILDEKIQQVPPEEADTVKEIKTVFHELEREVVRNMIINKGIRVDGRGTSDIRSITCEAGFLPRTHGSALFTRGETQSLAVVTLGTSDDEQRIDALEGETKRSFMLHYNFPPFSVGETRPLRGPGRREIGHGALALRALKPVIPSKEDFPYTLSHCFRHPRIEWIFIDGNGLWRNPRLDGCRCSNQKACRGNCDGPDQRGGASQNSLRYSWT